MNILTKNWGKIDPQDVNTYIRSGGYESFRKAIREMTPKKVFRRARNGSTRLKPRPTRSILSAISTSRNREYTRIGQLPKRIRTKSLKGFSSARLPLGQKRPLFI
jgi:hypothetical protein